MYTETSFELEKPICLRRAREREYFNRTTGINLPIAIWKLYQRVTREYVCTHTHV